MKKHYFLILILTILFFSCKKDKDDEKPIPSSANAFVTFSLPGQISSVINQGAHTIVVTMPFGIKLDSLVTALFTISPSATIKIGTVNQVSGQTLNNFSSPITYTITAENGTQIQDWTVTADYETYFYLSTDYPQASHAFYMNVATTGLSAFSLGSSGEGKIWNYTGLATDYVDTIKYLLPSQHLSSSAFPTATYVFSDNSMSIPIDMFANLYTDSAVFIGGHENYSGFGMNMAINSNLTNMIFPSSIGTSFTDVGTIVKDTTIDYNGTMAPVTLKVTLNISSTIDANGVVTTSQGSFNCLRDHRIQITNLKVLLYGTIELPYGGSDTLRTYNYLNKEKGYPVVTIEVDGAGNIIKIKHQQ